MTKTFSYWAFFVKFWPYVWLVFNSGFKSRAGYSGACMVVWSKNLDTIEPGFTYLLQGKMELFIISGQYEAKVATVM